MARSTKSARVKRAEKAAEQIYAHLCAGRKLEITPAMSMEDDVAQALMVLRKKHPDTVVTMLQSKSMVLMRGNSAKVAMSNEAWRHLDAHGYFPESQLSMETLFDLHKVFAAEKASVSADEIDKKALEDRRRDTAIGEVGSKVAKGGGSGADSPDSGLSGVLG